MTHGWWSSLNPQRRQKLRNHIPDPVQTILSGEAHGGYPFPEHDPIHPVVPILIVPVIGTVNLENGTVSFAALP